MKPSPMVTLSRATVRFRSDQLSDPALVSRSGGGTASNRYNRPDNPYVFTVDDGRQVRLWTKQGDVARRKALVPAGDAILADAVIRVADLNVDSVRTVTLYLEAVGVSTQLGDIRVQVELDPLGVTLPSDDDFVASDAVKATVFHIKEVHPIAGDFTPGEEGKILISAKQDAVLETAFHTEAKTTRQNRRAQTSPREVTISAHVIPNPPEHYPNLRVYFEVTDPDDRSHYEGKTTPGTPEVLGDINPNDNRVFVA